ncbi:MAG: CBS domain-containing protein [Pseudonocardia sp.]|nr:CBS domain-containing protein [Pseudonocardia sp.]
MRLDQVMSRPAVTVLPTDTIKGAAQIMAAGGFTLLPVVGPDGALAGVVNEGDLVDHRFPRDAREFGDPREPEQPAPPARSSVADVMVTEVLYATPDEDVPALIDRMRRARVRAVPVCDGNQVIGVVTYRDLVRILARSDELIAADVRRRLGLYTATGRFEVRVSAGEVELIDVMDRPAEWYTVRRLAEQVLGVLRARVVRPISQSQ